MENETELSKETVGFIHDLARYDQRLRYKNLKNDPTVQEAKTVINNTNKIIDEISSHPKCSSFMSEAKEVYVKILKENTSNS